MATKHECAQGSDIIGYRLQGSHSPMFVGGPAARGRSFYSSERKLSHKGGLLVNSLCKRRSAKKLSSSAAE